MPAASMADYMLRRYHRRRTQAVKQLGGCCAVCGSTVGLEIDHIDPKTKKFSLAGALASGAEKRVQQELKKCQLLCRKHHQDKSIEERGQRRVEERGQRRVTHGSFSMYKNYRCRCAECRKANNEHMRIYKKKRRLRMSNSLGQ